MNDNDVREAFETWARSHGGIDLQRTADIAQQTDGGWHFANYRSHTTEAAWRAWAGGAGRGGGLQLRGAGERGVRVLLTPRSVHIHMEL